MSSPNIPKPGRPLAFLALITLGLLAWTFWPGTTHTPRLGLDLQGGTQVTLLVTPEPGSESQITPEQISQTVAIIRQRVNGLGVSEAEVTTQGSGAQTAIIVSVPGVDQKRLVDLVGRTAKLNFRPVQDILNPGPPAPEPTASPSASGSAKPSASPSASASGNGGPVSTADSPSATPKASASASSSGTAKATSQNVAIQSPTNSADYQAKLLALDCTKAENRTGSADDPKQWLGACEKDGLFKANLQPAFILGTNIESATAELPQQGAGGWVVTLQFDSEGAKQLADISSKMVSLPTPQNQFAIVLDGIVISAPVFQSAILGGQAQITGNFTSQEAQDLANVLKFGALPVSLEAAQVTSVSASLGEDQLRAGLIAGAIGLLLVTLFLLFYYRALGLVAVLSLVVAGVLTYCVFVILGRQVGFALTLAGVAGAIVAIGVTADSFIVYFERIRDEMREGRSLRAAVDHGWIRARRTILAADFVSLLGAVVLYVLSIGSVRGFAFALGLTTAIDILVAFVFTRPLVQLLARSKWFASGSPMTGLDAKRLGITEKPASTKRAPRTHRSSEKV